MQAYYVKCRSKREIKNPQRVTLKNSRPATRGVCPVCGTGVFRIGKAWFTTDVAVSGLF
ncbi:MAG: DUF5679 domain-containing protein [Dehalococcoidales bacterium]|nr:DUF5679 domain-containing protein [Dehalococcoidales bacterium]